MKTQTHYLKAHPLDNRTHHKYLVALAFAQKERKDKKKSNFDYYYLVIERNKIKLFGSHPE